MKKQLLMLLTGFFIQVSAFGQIKTTEVEIRSATSSELNEIEGETTVKGRVNIRNSSAGGGVSGNYDNLVIEEAGTNIGLSFKSSNAHNAGIAFGDSDDQNSGRILYSHSNDHMSFYVNDAERFRILNNGYAGIGTTQPDGLLHLSSNSDNDSRLIVDMMGASGNIGLDLRSRLIGGGSYWIKALGDQETDAFVVKGNGYVGIGTETPSGRLEVANSGNSELVVRGGGTSHANAGIVLKATNGTNQRATGIYMHDEVGANEWFAGRPYSGSDKYVILRNSVAPTHNSANADISSTDVEALFTLNSDGNLGIGTVSPSKKLEVFSETIDVAARFTSDDERVSLMLRDHTTSNGVGISGIGDDLQILTGSGSSIAATFNAAKNLGLGTTTPNAKVHAVTGGNTNFTWSPSSGTSAIFESSTLNRNFLTIVAPGQSELWFADVDAQNAGKVRYVHSVDRMEFWTNNLKRVSIVDGNMGIGTQTPSVKLQVEGDITSTNMHSHSDRRWKKNISNITNVGKTLNEIRPVSYHWRADEFPEKDFDKELHYGVIAQELEEVLPELVSTDNEGYKSVDYLGMIGLLVKGFQERGEEIARLNEELSAKTASNKDELASLESRLARLEALLGEENKESKDLSTSEK